MSYLPEPVPAPPQRWPTGPLAQWLRDGLLGKVDSDTHLERVMLRFEVLYTRRRSSRRVFEASPDIPAECAWLLRTLEAEREALGLTFQNWQSVAGRVRGALRRYEGAEE